MTTPLTEALEFRHACKRFDENRKIPSEALENILEAGRMSPSSFGMEPWKFLVVQNSELKERLRPLCWNQVQITSCSDLVVILAKIDAVRPETEYVRSMFARRGLSEEQYTGYIGLYGRHLAHTMSTPERILAWTSRQCYIALGNMMSAAAMLGIDSCPVEGFEKEAVEAELGIDTAQFQLAVMLPLGYRVNEPGAHYRRAFDAVVEYR